MEIGTFRNRPGEITSAVTEGVAEYQYTYSPDNLKPVTEDITIPYEGGSLVRQIRRAWDQYGRSLGYTLANGPAIEQNVAYSYNEAGQIATITADGKTFQYTYEAGRPHLLAQMSSPVHTVINAWETARDVLQSKNNHWKNRADKGLISSYTYSVNSLNQRTSVATAGEAFGNTPADWQWSYDALGQVSGANTDEYTYDQIGNRIETKKDSQPADTYTSNALNQYTQVSAVTPRYDADGNLLTGLQPTENLPDRDQLTFIYNANNRPISVSKDNRILEAYTYDHQGRRVLNGNKVTIEDGFNAIAEYGASSSPVLNTSYSWGLDMVSSLTSSGGVGALLSTTNYRTQTPLTSLPVYDGNGNITQYLTEETSGLIAVHYEYDAFGNILRKEGTREYSYQFSTKPFHQVSGLNYYNYRDYDAMAGSWISRDPLNERGGFSLYAICHNDLLNSIDLLGLAFKKVESYKIIDYRKNALAEHKFSPKNEIEQEIFDELLARIEKNKGYPLGNDLLSGMTHWTRPKEKDNLFNCDDSCKIKVSDFEIEIIAYIYSDIPNDPGGNKKDKTGRTVLEHEKYHAELFKTNWNIIVDWTEQISKIKFDTKEKCEQASKKAMKMLLKSLDKIEEKQLEFDKTATW